MEFITVVLHKSLFDHIVNDCCLEANVDYMIKEVVLRDDFFLNDSQHTALKKSSNDAYKRLKEYEFKKRN